MNSQIYCSHSPNSNIFHRRHIATVQRIDGDPRH